MICDRCKQAIGDRKGYVRDGERVYHPGCHAGRMDADAYQQLALRTERTPDFIAPHKDGMWEGDARRLARVLHAQLGMNTEQAELADMIKKHLIYGKEFDPTNVIEECGDQLWYIALALDACGYTLSDCMERNINKLRVRFPDKFTEARALTRNLDAERQALEKRKTVAERFAAGLCADCGHAPHAADFGMTILPCTAEECGCGAEAAR